MPVALQARLPTLALLRERWSDARATVTAWARERDRRRRADEIARLQTPWQRYWGDTYGPDLKRWLLGAIFERLETEGKVGKLIVDIGSGAQPVSRMLARRPGRRRVLIDVAAQNEERRDELRIRLDAERALNPAALSCQKASLRIWRFLGQSGARADLMIFSDILNYVDFRKVLARFADFLRPGGRLLIVNLPTRGNADLFSEAGLRDNRDLFTFLPQAGFVIEEKSFPCRATDAKDEAEELVVLIARKVG